MHFSFSSKYIPLNNYETLGSYVNCSPLCTVFSTPTSPLLYLSGTLYSKNLVYRTACNDQHSSLLQPLLDLPNVVPSTPCLTETPVILEKLSSAEDLWKMTIQSPRSSGPPVLNVFCCQNLRLVFLFHQTWVLLRMTKVELNRRKSMNNKKS